MKNTLYGLFAEEIADLLTPFGFKKYRAKQIAEWIYRRNVTDFASMTNLTKAQRDLLSRQFSSTVVTVKENLQSDDKKTQKFLFALEDGMTVETVLMRHSYGNSVCVSTQIGCAMGCVFCASTLGGVVRNLTAGEIFAQVSYINSLLTDQGERVDTIVIMGMGEPFANYEQVVRFIHLCHQSYSLDLSYRSFTLSTSGIVPGIKRLAAEKVPVTLAISLHAPNDFLRSRLMPVNKQFPISSVLEAADFYASETGRRVTYEYILIAGINDSEANAAELGKLLKGRLANVNLIPINPVVERGLARPDEKTVAQFESILLGHRIPTTVRREMGTDIQAACGQLRRKHLKDNL